jgi:hypothetical protein
VAAVSLPAAGFGAPAAGPAQSRLRVGAAISLHLATTTALLGAEAPDGTFFYVPQPQRDNFGAIKPGTPGTKVVRVVDGHAAPTVAEHAPAPVVGLAADDTDLYVATPRRVIRYSRATGAEVRSWHLLANPVDLAQIVLAGRWMYISAGFQCDSCGIEYNTLLSINVVTGGRHLLAQVGPNGIAATRGHVWYTHLGGGLARSTPTGHSSEAKFSPRNFTMVLGRFRLGIVIATAGPHKTTVRVIDPVGTGVRYRWPASSDLVPELVPGLTGGGYYSDAQCPAIIAGSECGNDLGTTVSRVSLRTGQLHGAVRIPGIAYLVGPKPAVVTANHASYRLVRIR